MNLSNDDIDKFFTGSTDYLFHINIKYTKHFSSKLHSFFPQTKRFFVISQSLKKQKNCELLRFIVSKIVIFLRQFLVSYKSLNTKQVAHCDIDIIGFIVKKIWESLAPVIKLSLIECKNTVSKKTLNQLEIKNEIESN